MESRVEVVRIVAPESVAFQFRWNPTPGQFGHGRSNPNLAGSLEPSAATRDPLVRHVEESNLVRINADTPIEISYVKLPDGNELGLPVGLQSLLRHLDAKHGRDWPGCKMTSTLASPDPDRPVSNTGIRTLVTPSSRASPGCNTPQLPSSAAGEANMPHNTPGRMDGLQMSLMDLAALHTLRKARVGSRGPGQGAGHLARFNGSLP